MFDQIICKDIHSPDSDGSGTDNMTCILIEIKKWVIKFKFVSIWLNKLKLYQL